MLSLRVPLVLLMGAALHAAAPASATAHVRVGASILRPLSFSLTSLSDLRVVPALADGSTVLVSEPSRTFAWKVTGGSDHPTASLPTCDAPHAARLDEAPAVSVMLVYN